VDVNGEPPKDPTEANLKYSSCVDIVWGLFEPLKFGVILVFLLGVLLVIFAIVFP
jgi:hypothetical protein